MGSHFVFFSEEVMLQVRGSLCLVRERERESEREVYVYVCVGERDQVWGGRDRSC